MHKKRSILFLTALTFGISLISSNIVSKESFISTANDGGGVPVDNSTDYSNVVFYPASYPTSIENEPYYQEQNTKTFSLMNFHLGSDMYRGDAVKVAVIDSGINYNHEDFGTIKNASKYYEYSATDLKWYYYQYSNNPSKLNDTYGHGTNVASVIASQINQLGCAGIAPNVDLYIYKVSNTSNAYQFGAIQCALADCITNGVDVINMSFQSYEHDVSYGTSSMSGVEGCSTVLANSITDCYNNGITLVGAAGNYNTNEPSYPASNKHVISVGSLADGSTSSKAGFSNTYGIDLVAPGYVKAANIGSSSAYKDTSGTSFSAPIVTAAIALYKQKNPTASPDDIEKALYASCDAISGNPSWAGHGRLNLDKLLQSPTEISFTNVPNKTLELELGDTFQLQHSITPSDYSGDIEYTTYSDDVISVSSSGLITALGTGEETVSINPVGYSYVDDEIKVTVKPKTQSYWATWITQNQSAINTGGTTLLNALRTKISNVAPESANTLSYDDLWNAFAVTDGVPGSNGTKIVDMYGGFEFTKGTDQAGNYQKEGDKYNREHSVPKSWFDSKNPAYSDLVHLVPTDGFINGRRNNFTFGEVNSTSYSYPFPARSYNGVQYQKAGISKLGTPKAINGVTTTKSTVFEPDDQYKGDFARIYMYFAVRYGGTTCAATAGDGSAIFASSCTASNPYMTNYGLALVKKWHEQDPVSEKEINRNNGIESEQGNRNPFVDYPEWADKIFGTSTAKTLSSISVSENHRNFLVGDTFVKETVTATYSDGTHADVTDNAIFSDVNMSTAGTKDVSVSYTENSVTKDTSYSITVSEPKVTNLTLNKSSASLDVYNSKTTTLTATVTAEKGADDSVSWTTIDNDGVISLSPQTGTSTIVTAIKAGSAIVRATAGSISKDCTITVTDSTPILVTSITINGPEELMEGSSTNLSVSVLPSNATNKEVTWSSSNPNITVTQDGKVTAPSNSHGQTTTITATAKDGSGKQGTLEITITENVTVTSISIQYSGLDGESKVSFARYKSGTELDARVIGHLSNGETRDVTSEVTSKKFSVNYLILGVQTITATYPGLPQAKLNVFVTNKGSEYYVGVAKVTRAGSEYNATPTQQAEAWARYFIEVTGGGTNDGPCKLPQEQRENALENIWDGLQNEYGWMAGASKDQFCSNTTSSVIKEARDHYSYIVKTYSLSKFVVDSGNTPLALNSPASSLANVFNPTFIAIGSVTLVGIIVLIIFVVRKKRKQN